MATSETTGMITTSSGLAFKKVIRRLISTTSLTTGSTTMSGAFDTAPYVQGRLVVHAAAIGAGSTVTVKWLTGPSTDPTEVVLTSTGGTGVTLTTATTGIHRHMFTGLDCWSEVSVNEAGGAESTGLDIDVQLM